MEKDIKDTFRCYKKTVADVLRSKRYCSLAEQVYQNYPDSKNLPLGDFLYSLKQQGDLLYLNFLNRYGDGVFCTFTIQNVVQGKLRGLYAYGVDERLMYIGRCRNCYRNRIDRGYGKIHPKNCYLDGQATNCHINNLLNEYMDAIEFYIYPLENEAEITTLERELILQYKPEWNIASFR